MSSDRWRRVESLYHAALNRPAGERAAFLDQNCADTALRGEVAALLQFHSASGSALDRPAWDRQLQPGDRIGPYEIVERIGAGGMGEVYRATDTKLHRAVALKFLTPAYAEDPQWLSRFQREARVLASMNHPNIATIHGLEEGALVMELVEGPTLADEIAKGPVRDALTIARAIAEALEYAHEKGIVHRDLKPANIKISTEGAVKVLDFGLAKAAAQREGSDTVTATDAGVVMGTPGYMAPEQAGGLAVDKRADIWAFGVVLFEMLTGRRVFDGVSVVEVLAAVVRDEPPWAHLPPRTPAAVRTLLERCLEKDPKRRLRDIGGARLLLDQPMVADRRPARIGLWPSIAAALGVLLIGLSVAHFRVTAPEAAPVRFQIAAPEKNDYAGGGMALSPDGRQLAFIATGAGSGPMLWVRSLDSVDVRQLPGTEGAAAQPFWSPDGHSIAFGAGRKLKKVNLSGGTPQTIAELPGIVIGGSWNREGTILFGFNTGGLYRVAASGGDPVPVTKTDPSTGELGQIRPWFLPDGRHFIYVSRMSDPAESAIYLATLDGPERRRLVASRQSGAYAPPAAGSPNGHLLFLHDGVLMAHPMDPKRYQLTGEPFPVVEQVASVLMLGFFTVSGNGVIAYRAGASTSGSSAQLSWIDRGGKLLQALAPGPFYAGGARLSPDGKRVAVDQVDSTQNRDVWIVESERASSTRFTFDRAYDVGPVWSPDGSQIVFSSDRGSPGVRNLYLKSSNGSGAESLLLKTGRSLTATSWSADGRYLMYSSNDPQYRSDLWVLPMQSGAPGQPAPYLQGTFNERGGQFSPDGRWVAYDSDESALQPQVYVQSFPAGGGKFQISISGGMLPRWRSDGREIFFVSNTSNQLLAVPVKPTPRFEAGAPQALFGVKPAGFVPGSVANSIPYDVAPDGNRFLLITPASQPASAPSPITVVLNWNSGRK